MKIIIILLCFAANLQTALAQKLNVDSILRKMSVEKEDDKKVDLAVSLFLNGLDRDPYLTIQTGQALLKQGMENNDQIKEAAATAIHELYQVAMPPHELLVNETKPEFIGNYTIVTFGFVNYS